MKWSKEYWPQGQEHRSEWSNIDLEWQESSDQSDPMGGHGHSAVGHHCSYVEMSCWMRAHYLLIKLAPCWSADLPKVAAEWINYRRIQAGVWINLKRIHARKSRLVFRLTQIESRQEIVTEVSILKPWRDPLFWSSIGFSNEVRIPPSALCTLWLKYTVAHRHLKSSRQICKKNIARGTTDPGNRVNNLSYLSS